jgi:hypothetical protein
VMHRRVGHSLAVNRHLLPPKVVVCASAFKPFVEPAAKTL